MRIRLALVARLALVSSCMVALWAQPAPTYALSGGEFQAGNIIDDAVFFSPYDLSVSQVQEFLNAKVPTCDTNGTQPYNGTTAAAYGSSRGQPPPYICLKEYRANTNARAAEDGLCNGYPATNQSAAEIIVGVAQSCGVSARALIVLLQKEQGLVTDNWPWTTQYQKATGYGCPDSAPCDSQYYGFFNQVYSAARQFKRYVKDSGLFNYAAGRNNYILYNPNTDCGGSTVYIQNHATAGLYNYTPYQPNTAALNNLYGTGDGCSSYGNRNFWRLFNDWFGSTQDPFDNASIRLSAPLTITPSTLYEDQTYTASFSITNSASYPINIGTPMVVVRGPQGQNRDVPGDVNVTIQANSTYTFSKQWFTPDVGWHQFSIVLYKPGLGFSYSAPTGTTPTIVRNLWIDVKANPRVATSFSISPVQPAAGQNYTASFTVRNDSTQTVDIGYPFVIVRGPQGQNRDIPIGDRVSIPANSTYTFSKQWFTPDPGAHTFTIATYIPGLGMLTNYPVAGSGVAKTLTATMLDSPVVSTSLTLPSEIIAGVPYTASYSITNKGSSAVNIGSPMVVVRGPQGQNRDVPGDPNVTIPANSTYTFSKQWFTPDPGAHQFSIVVYKSSTGFSYTLPASENGSIVRALTRTVKPAQRITTSLSISPSPLHVNQMYTASFTVRNDSTQAVDIGYPFVVVRGPQGQNRDVPISDRITIPANSTYTFSKQWFTPDPGAHTFTIATYIPGQGMLTNYPAVDTGVSRTITVQVQP